MTCSSMATGQDKTAESLGISRPHYSLLFKTVDKPACVRGCITSPR